MSAVLNRSDGRAPNQLRQIETDLALLNRADGSCKYSQSKTCVLVAVYGPMEVKQRKEHIDKATVEIVFKPQTGLEGTTETEQEYFIRNAVENVVIAALHPRTSITIVIQVLNDDGSILSTCINAVSLALLDAGIALKSVLSSITCCITKDTLLLDPSKKEEQASDAHFVFTFNSSFDGLVSSKTTGMITTDQYLQCLSSAQVGASKVLAYIRTASEQKYKQLI